MAGIGRTGIMLDSVISSELKNLSLDNPPIFPLFSSAGIFYSPSSLVVGQFKMLTQYMLSGSINETSNYNALPMIPDLKNNSYFTNYRFKSVGQDEKELNELIGWLGASDITYLAPYISVGMQNWTVAIDSLEENIKLKIDKILNIKVADLENKPINDLVNALSEEIAIDGKMKSLLNILFDELNASANSKPIKPEAQSITKCDFNNFSLPACSIYNILLNGHDSQNVGIIELSELKPFLTKNEVPLFAELLNELGKKESGIHSIITSNDKVTNLYKLYKVAANLNFSKEKLEPMLVFLASSNLFLYIKYKENNPIIATNALKVLLALSVLKDNKEKIVPELMTELGKIKEDLLINRKSAPGSIIFLHVTQDKVVPYTQSLIAKKAMDAVFDAVYSKNQLKDNPLVKNKIPAIGSQLFSFQPEDRFFTVNLGERTSDGSICSDEDKDKKIPNNYNAQVKKCFGSKKEDSSSKNRRVILAHGDTAVRTARLISEPLSSMEYDRNKEVIKDTFRYGNQSMAKTVQPASISSQLADFDAAYNLAEKLKNPSHQPINYYLTSCNIELVTGICYVEKAQNSTVQLSINQPLFHRTLLQDLKREDPFFEGKVVNSSKTAALTPTDIFTLWMESAALEASGLK